MYKVIILMLIAINVASANELIVSIEPKEPVVGESFNVTFKVITQNGTDPIINFNPSPGIEVLGRQEAGITTSTSYINGNLSVERSISIVYEMVSTSYGTKYLRDIEVEVNGAKAKYKNLRIPVLKMAKRPKNIMAIAEVDKDEVYVGESILVRYYLYSKVSINGTDIKKFPKLGKFLKRYHQEKSIAQKVRYNGEIYTRRVLYTAQLFADKAGDYKIDPITLRVQYLKSSQGGYNNFGFGFRRQMSTTVTSKSLNIKVKKLPVEQMPSHFTGLVGKHSFTLTQNKNKFLVNDPIEIKVTVKGEGALELFELPNLFKDPNIEEFDTNNELEVASDFLGTKIFNLTLLGRAAVSLPQADIPLSYFDPETEKYVTQYLKLKAIKVAGTSQFVPSQGHSEDKSPPPSRTRTSEVIQKTNLMPVYTFANSYLYSSKYINLSFIGILLCLFSFFSYKKYRNYTQKEKDFFQVVKKEGVNFGRLHMMVLKLGDGSDMRDIIQKSGLNTDSKKYFTKLIDTCEKEYSENGHSKVYKVKTKYLKDVIKTIEENNDYFV